MNTINIGLLEFGFRDTRLSSVGNILEVLEYARTADALDYACFWLGEHHNLSAHSTWSNPQMLLPVLLGHTDTIRMGMAGVLMNYYSPYEVALNFRLLANLYPERVDLGFANGNPPERAGQLMLHQKFEFDKRPRNFYKHIEQLTEMYYDERKVALRDEFVVPPYRGLIPDLFMLSSSFRNFQKAVDLRLHIAKSNFHVKDSLENCQLDNIRRYRDAYAERYGEQPKVVMAFMGACHRDEQHAKSIAKTFSENTIGFRHLYNPVIGTPERFYDTLCSYQEKFEIDDFVFLDCALRNEDRIDALYWLNEVFNLSKDTVNSPSAAMVGEGYYSLI